jgi:hypothetical protein
MFLKMEAGQGDEDNLGEPEEITAEGVTELREKAQKVEA